MSLHFKLPYGHEQYQEVTIEEKNFVGLLKHRKAGSPMDEAGLRSALASPVGTPPLEELVLIIAHSGSMILGGTRGFFCEHFIPGEMFLCLAFAGLWGV